MLHRLIITLLFLLASTVVCAQGQRVGIVYYDLDHLYDTIPAPFYNDTDYTPRGKLGWTQERYNRKIRNTAAVIDSMRMPIVALWSVESELVVRDLAAACEGGYSYLHRTLNSLDGMDFALLYYGDVFFPHHVESGRRYLYIEGTLQRAARRIPGHATLPARTDTIGLVLCSEVRMAEWVVRDLREERPRVKLIAAGRMPERGLSAYALQDPFTRAERSGRGNIRRRAGWAMRDRILVDTALRVWEGDVFARRYLVDQKSGIPLSTYDRQRYRGGYGYALPVFVYLE